VTLRLNRFLALSGLGARRKCDLLIASGRVEINGALADRPGVQVDPERDRVTFDGERVRAARRFHYLMIHKPSGLVVTASDERGRATVYDLLPKSVPASVRAVGRLDKGSEGLLLFTNDGELAHSLLHPSRGVERTYLVWVRPGPSIDAVRMLRAGVALGRGEKSGPAYVRVLGSRGGTSRVRLTLSEGKNREVRRMFRAIGCRVLALRRIRFDGVELGRLPVGGSRRLEQAEIVRLRSAVGRRRGG